MQSQKRRKLLLLAGTPIAGMALRGVWPGPLHGRIPSSPGAVQPGAGVSVNLLADDPILQGAVEWIAQLRAEGHNVVRYPVSRLQRWSRVGYSRACAVAAQLELQGAWHIGFDGNGARYAHLYPREQAWA